MLYPVYVHKDKDSAFGLTFPDLPCCFVAADEPAGIPRAAQEAVEANYGNDADPIPAPSGVDRWAASKDFKGGFWCWWTSISPRGATKNIVRGSRKRRSKG